MRVLKSSDHDLLPKIWTRKSVLIYWKMPISTILELMFGFFHIFDWTKTMESEEFASVELQTIIIFVVLAEINSKENPWAYKTKIAWQVLIIFSCEEMMFHLQRWRFWNTKFQHDLRDHDPYFQELTPLNGTNSWKCWSRLNFC